MLPFFQLTALLMLGLFSSCGSNNAGEKNHMDTPPIGETIVQIKSFESRFQYGGEPGGAKIRYVNYNSLSGNAIVAVYKPGETPIDGNSTSFSVGYEAERKINDILHNLDSSKIHGQYNGADDSLSGSTDGTSMHMTFYGDAYKKDVVIAQGASDAPLELHQIFNFVTDTFAFAVSNGGLT